jgi:protocatechuate 3,4-dioxygenase beta subunit
MSVYPEYQIFKHVKAAKPKLKPTQEDIEGPFYKEGAPYKDVFVEGGELTLIGNVRGIDGELLDNAVLDFWQADPTGTYDNEGYTLRGKVLTNGGGEYKLTTVRPGYYKISDNEHRCAHIQVKVSAPGYKTLTTQLYFENSEYNDTDNWFNPELVIKDGVFNFVLMCN